jgi:hypothetical protein
MQGRFGATPPHPPPKWTGSGAVMPNATAAPYFDNIHSSVTRRYLIVFLSYV